MTAPASKHAHPGPRWVVRLVVYIMLVTSALGAFVFGERLWQAARVGSLPLWAPLVPAIAFTAFVLVYMVDRWLLVRRHNYPVVRAFFQVAAAAAFVTLLWPQQATELRRIAQAARPPADAMLRLLSYADPDVRRAACELAGLKRHRGAEARIRQMAESDPTPSVRDACREALGRIDAAGAVGAE